MEEARDPRLFFLAATVWNTKYNELTVPFERRTSA
jgi:hypothetical protein